MNPEGTSPLSAAVPGSASSEGSISPANSNSHSHAHAQEPLWEGPSKQGLLDMCLILAGLLTANTLFSSEDPGWARLQPSPYFFLPLLMGCRYGFALGLLGGIAAAAVLAGAPVVFDGMAVESALETRAYSIIALLLAGAAAGQFQEALRRREQKLRAANRQLQEKFERVDSDLHLLRGTQAELERRLLTHGAELATLDSDIRRLFELEQRPLHEEILFLLSRRVRLRNAALYLYDPGRTCLERKALLGPPELLPEKMPAQEVRMVRLALEQRQPVSVQQLWDLSRPSESPYLMCVPLLDVHGEAIGAVLVREMPFTALHQRAVHLASLICRWAARVIQIQEPASAVWRQAHREHKVVTPHFFRRDLELACLTHRMQKLPSSVALFTVPGKSPGMQSRLERLILDSVRTSDLPSQLNFPVANLAVLLPFVGQRGASVFMNRIMAACQKDSSLSSLLESQVITLNDSHTAEQVWQALTSNVENASARA